MPLQYVNLQLRRLIDMVKSKLVLKFGAANKKSKVILKPGSLYCKNCTFKTKRGKLSLKPFIHTITTRMIERLPQAALEQLFSCPNCGKRMTLRKHKKRKT